MDRVRCINTLIRPLNKPDVNRPLNETFLFTVVLFQRRTDQIDGHPVQDEVAYASYESRFHRERPHAGWRFFMVRRPAAESQHYAVL